MHIFRTVHFFFCEFEICKKVLTHFLLITYFCIGWGISADGFVVQTGDPEGPSEGFVDPATGQVRKVPLEIMVDGDKEPIYGATLEVRDYVSLNFLAGTILLIAAPYTHGP